MQSQFIGKRFQFSTVPSEKKLLKDQLNQVRAEMGDVKGKRLKLERVLQEKRESLQGKLGPAEIKREKIAQENKSKIEEAPLKNQKSISKEDYDKMGPHEKRKHDDKVRLDEVKGVLEDSLALPETFFKYHTKESIVTDLIGRGKFKEVKNSLAVLKSTYYSQAISYKDDPEFQSKKQSLIQFIDQSEKKIQSFEEQLKLESVQFISQFLETQKAFIEKIDEDKQIFSNALTILESTKDRSAITPDKIQDLKNKQAELNKNIEQLLKKQKSFSSINLQMTENEKEAFNKLVRGLKNRDGIIKRSEDRIKEIEKKINKPRQ